MADHKVRHQGSWQPPSEIHARVGGGWQLVQKVFAKSGGVWREVYTRIEAREDFLVSKGNWQPGVSGYAWFGGGSINPGGRKGFPILAAYGDYYAGTFTIGVGGWAVGAAFFTSVEISNLGTFGYFEPTYDSQNDVSYWEFPYFGEWDNIYPSETITFVGN